MVRPWSRKRSGAHFAAADAPTETAGVHLTGDEHAWWSQSEVAEAWKPKTRRTHAEQEAADKRDILAEHFGADWRTSFGFTPPDEASSDEASSIDASDPYEVLGLQSTASWADIVTAHRDLVRLHHPDRLVGQSEHEQAAGEERIRVINTAYQELQVRRGK